MAESLLISRTEYIGLHMLHTEFNWNKMQVPHQLV